MNTHDTDRVDKPAIAARARFHAGRWIALGLVLGVICGILFGDYCAPLQVAGEAYVGLLQMTVLPYLVFSLIGKMGRLDWQQARELGVTLAILLLLLAVVGIVLILAVSMILPPLPGATFFSPTDPANNVTGEPLLSEFIPENVFRSLAQEFVPGVVVFCLFFGVALISIPNKEPLLDFLDLCTTAIGRINMFLVRLAPFGLFALTAAAAGTISLVELSRLQAYLIMFVLASVVAAFGVMPLLVSSVTRIKYRELIRAANEPMLTAIATGKLFVVLPQVVDNCEQLLEQADEELSELGESAAKVVAPLAYSFPHVGKILAFTFVAFAGWYVGRDLTAFETIVMATTGAVSSFASPLISIPTLLDQYQLPQDLLSLFILPGFITMRVADVVGVFQLMALCLIVSTALQGRLRFRWRRAVAGLVLIVVCLGLAGLAGRWYLAATSLEYDLDDRLMALEVSRPHEDVVVYRSAADVPPHSDLDDATLDRVRSQKVIRVGYIPDKLPYTFTNSGGNLVGFDIELMHQLATELQVRLEFVPCQVESALELLESGQVDLIIGGIFMNPDRLLRVGFTQPYQTATIAVALPDHRRNEFNLWDDPHLSHDDHLGVLYESMARAAQRELPNATIEVIESYAEFFSGNRPDLDGIIMAAEEGAAWNVLHPEYSVVVPQPIVQRPISIVTRANDTQWLRFLDRWIDLKKLDGAFDRLYRYWIEGKGTDQQVRRWCILRDVLHWLP